MLRDRPFSTASHDRYSSAPVDRGRPRWTAPSVRPSPAARRRRARPTPRMVVASTIVPSSTMASNRASGTCSTRMYRSSMPWRSTGTGVSPVARYTDEQLVAEPRGDGAPGEQLEPVGGVARPPRPARRRAVTSAGSPSTSQVPAGTSRIHRSRAGRYWWTSTTAVVVGDGHHGHRAGVADHVPLEGHAVGIDEGRPGSGVITQPRWTTSSPSGPEGGQGPRPSRRRGPRPRRPQPRSPMSVRRGSRPSARVRAA